MSVSDWITLSLSVLSFLLAVISVITVVLTLKQNSRMIEESNRPYIAIYGDETNFSSPQFYIILKNFGRTGAIIKDITCDLNLEKYAYNTGVVPFQHIVGTMLAPNQNFICSIDNHKLNDDDITIINFDIVYETNKKQYSEHYQVNYQALKKNIKVKTATKDKELSTISYTLQEMVQKDL